MRSLLLAIPLLFSFGLFADNFYLVVRGSSDWYNYRHEADVYHFSNLLLKNGVNRKNIVVMTYDDIAFNKNNPKPGFIENQVNGTNVYNPDLKPDYRGKDVTPENFLHALQNLGTTEKDNIWVYWTDHGGPRVIAFPHSELYADDLMKTILDMNQQKKFGQMVFYLEACESGSMFDGLLPNDINVYAVTASTPIESSWACGNDPSIGTYTGDKWSVSFLQDLDKGHLNKWTFQDQFDQSKRLTTKSTPCQYGDLSLAQKRVGAYFQGNHSTFNDSENDDSISTWELANPKVRAHLDALFNHIIAHFGLESDLKYLENLNKSDDACHQDIYRNIDMERYKRLMAHYPDRSYLKHARVLAILSLPSYCHISEESIVKMLK